MAGSARTCTGSSSGWGSASGATDSVKGSCALLSRSALKGTCGAQGVCVGGRALALRAKPVGCAPGQRGCETGWEGSARQASSGRQVLGRLGGRAAGEQGSRGLPPGVWVGRAHVRALRQPQGSAHYPLSQPPYHSKGANHYSIQKEPITTAFKRSHSPQHSKGANPHSIQKTHRRCNHGMPRPAPG